MNQILSFVWVVDYFFRRPNIFERLLPLSSLTGGEGAVTGSGGGSDVRRNAARSEVRDTLEVASRGSNFFMGTRRPEEAVETGGGRDWFWFSPVGCPYLS